GLGLLVLALIRAQSAGLGAGEVLLTGGAALVLLVIFVVVEARFAEAPMLPLELFRSRPFSVTNLLTLFLYAALGGALVYLPLTLIEVHGYSPLAAGAALLPFVVVLSVLARFSGGLVDRVGARLPLTVGPMVAAGGFLLLAVPDRGGSYWTTFFPGMVVLGLGMALVVAPLTTTVLSAVATRHAGTASGVNNAVSRTGGLLAVAIFGVVLVHTFDSALDRSLQSIPLTAAQHAQLDAQRSRLALTAAPDGLDAPTAAAVDDAVASAFVSGVRAVLISAAALAAASALTAAIGLPARRRPVPAATRAEGVRAEAPA
ncbi:MAG TPA: MFS transporter, partial [Candidatus Dormibacteraeota bacterium]